MEVTFANSTDRWFLSVSPVYLISFRLVHLVAALPLNAYVVFLLFPRKEGMEAADVFTLNQAIAEIIFIFSGPFQCVCSMSSEWCFFKLLGFLLGLCMSSRVFFQCFVCLERYMAVVRPLMFLRYKAIRYRIGCCILGWIAGVVFGLGNLLTSTDVPYGFYASFYVAMLALNVFFCMSILKKLRHPGPGDRERAEKEMNNLKKKSFQVVSSNLMVFMIQAIPTVVSIGLHYGENVNKVNLASVNSIVIISTSGILHPIFVLHRFGKLSNVVWLTKCGTPSLTCCQF